MTIQFPEKAAGEKLFESELLTLRRDLLNMAGDTQTSAGSANDYELTLDAQINSLDNGQVIIFKANFTNTGAVTLDVNAIGPEAVLLNGVALAGGEIVKNRLIILQWDGANFQLLNPAGLSGGTGVDGVQGDADLTIAGSNNTYIEKNFTEWTAGSVARTCTVTPTGCVVHIKVKGDADLTNWIFNFTGKGAPGGNGGGAVTGDNIDGNDGNDGTTPSVATIPIYLPGGAKGLKGTASNGVGGTALSISPIPVTNVNVMKAAKAIIAAPGAGGGGGGSGSCGTSGGVDTSGAGGPGGAGGGCLIIEVGGNVIFASTTVNCDGVNGTNGSAKSSGTAAGGGGGGGGGGGFFGCFYDGSISGSPTVDVGGGTAGSGGNGVDTSGREGGGGGAGGAGISENGDSGNTASSFNGAAGGAGGDGLSVIAKNKIF